MYSPKVFPKAETDISLGTLAIYQKLSQKIFTEKLSVRLPMTSKWAERTTMSNIWVQINKILSILSLLRTSQCKESDVFRTLWNSKEILRTNWEEGAKRGPNWSRICRRDSSKRRFLDTKDTYQACIPKTFLEGLISSPKWRLRGSSPRYKNRRTKFCKENSIRLPVWDK